MRRSLLLIATLLLIASCSNTDTKAMTAPEGTTLSTGDIAGDPYLLIAPAGYVAGSKPAVIYLHGATQTEAQIVDTKTYAGLSKLIADIARAGYPVVAIRAGGDLWGNADARGKVAAARTYAQTNLGAAPGKVIVVGGSMGGATALTYASTAKGDVACVVGLVPVSDIADLAARNPSNLKKSIDAAHPDLDPAELADSNQLAGIKYKAWYGAKDEVVPPATVTDLVAKIGPTGTAVAVDGDHDTTIDKIPPADVVSYLASC